MSQLAAFLGVSILVIVIPGPDTALTIRNTLLGGSRAGVPTALGVASGQACWTLAASAGVAALLVASEPAFLAVKVVGAAYLAFLGFGALRRGGSWARAFFFFARTGHHMRQAEPAIPRWPRSHRLRAGSARAGGWCIARARRALGRGRLALIAPGSPSTAGRWSGPARSLRRPRRERAIEGVTGHCSPSRRGLPRTWPRRAGRCHSSPASACWSRASSPRTRSPSRSPSARSPRAPRWCSRASAAGCASPSASPAGWRAPPTCWSSTSTTTAHIAAVAADLEERWGRLDGLLHAVAFAPEDALGGRFLTTPPESAELAFRTSAFSLKALAAGAAAAAGAGGGRRGAGGAGLRRHRGMAGL